MAKIHLTSSPTFYLVTSDLTMTCWEPRNICFGHPPQNQCPLKHSNTRRVRYPWRGETSGAPGETLGKSQKFSFLNLGCRTLKAGLPALHCLASLFCNCFFPAELWPKFWNFLKRTWFVTSGWGVELGSLILSLSGSWHHQFSLSCCLSRPKVWAKHCTSYERYQARPFHSWVPVVEPHQLSPRCDRRDACLLCPSALAACSPAAFLAGNSFGQLHALAFFTTKHLAKIRKFMVTGKMFEMWLIQR